MSRFEDPEHTGAETGGFGGAADQPGGQQAEDVDFDADETFFRADETELSPDETVSRADEPGFGDDETALGLGIAELAYLLARFDSPAAHKSVEMLQVNEDYLAPLVTAVGASSLLARGLLHLNGDEVQPSEALSIVNYVLAAAERWVELGFVGEASADGGLLLQAPEASMFLHPLSLGAWRVLVKGRGSSDVKTLRSLVDTHFDAYPQGAVHFGSTTVQSVQTLSVRKDGEYWSVGFGAGGKRMDTGGPGLTSHELDEKLGELVSN